MFGAETVDRFLHTSYDAFAGRATITAYLPLLAERFARQRLKALAMVEGKRCGDACPIHPGKRYLDWELADPAGQSVDDVRPIRDDIEIRVRALLTELGVPLDNSASTV